MARVNLQAILDAFDKEREDFDAAIKALPDILKKRLDEDKKEIDQALLMLADKFAELNTAHAQASEQRTTQLKDNSKNLEVALNKAISEMRQKIDTALSEQTNGMNYIYDKVASLKDGQPGQPGKDANADEIAEKVTAQLLPLIEEKLAAQTPVNSKTYGGYTPLVRTLHNQSFPETPDGIRTTFTLVKPPKEKNGVVVIQNRTRCHLTDDFTVSNRTVTFLVAPQTGDKLMYDLIW